MRTSAKELFEFHANVANLPVITPPFPPFRLVSEPKHAEEGDAQEFRVGWDRLGSTWTARISRVVPGRLMEDTLVTGPFAKWRHQHRFVDTAPGHARLTDAISFRLLPTRAGEFVEFFTVRPMIIGMFRYRHWKTRRILENNNS